MTVLDVAEEEEAAATDGDCVELGCVISDMAGFPFIECDVDELMIVDTLARKST